jgi:hypothetical protein
MSSQVTCGYGRSVQWINASGDWNIGHLILTGGIELHSSSLDALLVQPYHGGPPIWVDASLVQPYHGGPPIWVRDYDIRVQPHPE